MLQLCAGLAATSNPFCVNGEQFLSRNREMPGDMHGLMRRSKMYRGTFWRPGTFCSWFMNTVFSFARETR
jgi:hypothetical protein